MDDSAGQKNPELGAVRREAAFVFIFATVLLDMLAVGIIIPVLPKLVFDFLGGNAGETAKILGIFGTAWALMQFFFSPLQGALSDSFGRRLMILLSNFGVGLDYVLMALAPTLGWLFVGRVISGITAASISTAYAYVADVTPPDKRAARFGLLGAAFGAGFVLGPALGGLAGTISPRLPFWIAAGLSLANACYGLVILPESLPIARRARFAWRRANPFGALALLRSQALLLRLAFVNFLGNLAHAVLPSIGVLYMMYRYGWNESLVGLTLAAVGVASIVVQGLVVGPVTRWVGERAALMLGLVFGVGGFLIFALAPTGLIFWLAIPVMALWGLEGPACMALMSRLVGASEQGQLQGANASVTGIANLFGPGLFTLTFAFAIGGGREFNLPGAPFLIASFLLAAAAVAAWLATRE
ncbi:MAG TPA: TCR/Tet family MFS transporter [Xanthobacteraceae bacterium]|jgi:DHA1 family tetracycline resistance protein-like MFS transporter|nr:TCR/Tet family MFS transporter [Xanthobacteraceae bacterium]